MELGSIYIGSHHFTVAAIWSIYQNNCPQKLNLTWGCVGNQMLPHMMPWDGSTGEWSSFIVLPFMFYFTLIGLPKGQTEYRRELFAHAILAVCVILCVCVHVCMPSPFSPGQALGRWAGISWRVLSAGGRCCVHRWPGPGTRPPRPLGSGFPACFWKWNVCIMQNERSSCLHVTVKEKFLL